MKLIERPKYGPLHRFSDYHIYKTLSVLSDGARIGRKMLSDKVGIGEGSMRTIVDYVREREYIDVKQTGIKITKAGLEFLQTIPIQTYTLNGADFTKNGEKTVAVQVKGVAEKIGNGMDQRDHAMMAGADGGALTVIVKDGKLYLPGDKNYGDKNYLLKAEYPETDAILSKLFDLDDGDIVIIGTASTPERAEEGAVSAALLLL